MGGRTLAPGGIYIWYPPPPRPILSQNLLVFALFCCFLLCLNVCFFLRLFYIFKKLCSVVKTLPPLIKLFSFNRKGFFYKTSRKPKNQKTKTFWRSFGFRSKDGFFWFSLSFFGFFWFRFLKTKKNLGFFGFLKEALVEERQKTKKTQVFFGFFMDSSYISSKHLTKKPKKTWVFLVFCLSSTKASFKKPKKPKVFFGF